MNVLIKQHQPMKELMNIGNYTSQKLFRRTVFTLIFLLSLSVYAQRLLLKEQLLVLKMVNLFLA
jgi:hypothetical protein